MKDSKFERPTNHSITHPFKWQQQTLPVCYQSSLFRSSKCLHPLLELDTCQCQCLRCYSQHYTTPRYPRLSCHRFTSIHMHTRMCMSAGWRSGYIYASQVADRGLIPGCGKSSIHTRMFVITDNMIHEILPKSRINKCLKWRNGEQFIMRLTYIQSREATCLHGGRGLPLSVTVNCCI